MDSEAAKLAICLREALGRCWRCWNNEETDKCDVCREAIEVHHDWAWTEAIKDLSLLDKLLNSIKRSE